MALGKKETRMEKLAQYNKKIVFKDLDNFYAERETFETEDEWHIYSKEGYYVGYIFLGQGAGITYPKDLNDEPSQWTMKPLEVNNLKKAIRYIYLNWQRINHKNSTNEIRKIVREIFMGNDWSEPEWWTKNKWSKDSPGPDPFSPDALGSAIGSAMNTCAEGEEETTPEKRPTQYFVGKKENGIMVLDRDRNNPIIKNGKEYLRINNIIIPEKLRHQGIATNLYKTALEKAKKEGYAGIVSDSKKIEDKTGAIKKIHKNFNITKQKYEIDLGARPRDVTFIEPEWEVIPEYWKNGGDEPLFPEPFSDGALGNYFMPESDEMS